VTKALQPDDLIAHYRVIRALGAGGMGEVYLARDSTLDRDIALKVLPQMAQNDDRVRRFVLEAKSASSLSHPHIITVYEIGCEPVISGGVPRAEKVNYIAMELVDGAALADIIHDDQHRTDLKTLLEYLAQAADGLAKAHASGIVHRDLKPGNIMVSKDGYAKVLDFGLAKLVEKDAAPDATINVATKQALTVEGMIVGTIGYMAPEQILGRPVDHRSDIFSFGCILYEAITRQRPFTADSQFEALQKIIHEHPAPMESFVADVPTELRQLVGRCLAKSPDERIPSMKDVSADLRRISGSYEVLARSAAGTGDATVFFPSASGAIPSPSGVAAPSGAAWSTPGVAPSGVALPAKKKLPLAAIAGGAVVVLALLGFLVYKFALAKSGGLSDQALSQMKVSQILSNENLLRIAVAPGGKFAAYITLTNAKKSTGESFQAYTLKVRQISTGGEAEIVKTSETPITGLSFTPDGDNLYYVVQDPKNDHYSNLFMVPSLGSIPPVEVLKNVDTEVTFDKEGKRFAFMRGDPVNAQATSLVIYDTSSRAEKVTATVKSAEDISIDKPRWSPDGLKIAVVYPRNPPRVVVVDVASGKEETIGKWDVPLIDSVAWMGTDALLVAAGPANAHQLWHMAYPGGDRRRLINDTYHYTDVSTSTDGATITARRQFRGVQMWQIPSSGGPEDMKQAPVGSSGPENMSSIGVSEDGTIVFVAPKESASTLWAATTGARKALLTDPISVVRHQIIRGQKATAFTGFGADFTGHVYRVGVDGTQFKKLTDSSGENLVAVSPDGKYVFYNTAQAPRTLTSMSADGGTASPVATDYIDDRGLAFSQDSKLMSYNRLVTGAVVASERVLLPITGGQPIAKLQPAPRTANYQFNVDATLYTYIDQQKAVMSVPLNGGASSKLLEMSDARIDLHRWIDPKSMVLSARSTAPDKPAATNLFRWSVGSQKAVQLTSFPTGIIFELLPSADGKTLYFIQGALNRDIVMIRGLK
jgi:Tol biopolymer transport system component